MLTRRGRTLTDDVSDDVTAARATFLKAPSDYDLYEGKKSVTATEEATEYRQEAVLKTL